VLTRWLSKLTLNQRLGAAALVLGFLALFASVAPARTVRVHEKDLLTAIERGEDHVSAPELASWIVEGRSDYRLVDVRDSAAYAEYHIPTAESLPLATIADGGLGRTDNVVLYGDGVVHAAQAYTVLKGKGFTSVRTLRDGLDAWKKDVLFPVRPAAPSADEQARFERALQVAKFFGGQARAADAPGAGEPLALAAPAMPSVAPPTLPGGGSAAPKRRKKEGC
jgi:rhodanese-related sulfurtransferase